ncbi:acylphosphatase [bacterium]|nr:acylphosphatase [bacterium]
MKTVQVWVSGHVQGVGFRWHVRQWAQRLGISGWVRNLPDGRVELKAQGQRLDEFLRKVAQGPQGAKVTSLQDEWTDLGEPLGSFQILSC